MKEKERPFTVVTIVFALALVLALGVCVAAILARENVYTLSFFDDTDLLFVIIISAILALIFLICVTVLITTRISLAAVKRADEKRKSIYGESKK